MWNLRAGRSRKRLILTTWRVGTELRRKLYIGAARSQFTALLVSRGATWGEGRGAKARVFEDEETLRTILSFR